MASELTASTSAALVSASAHSEMIRAGGELLCTQLALRPQDMQTIQRGIGLYFDPSQNKTAADWIQRNRTHIQDITQIGREAVDVRSKLDGVSATINATTEELTAVETEKTGTHAELRTTEQTFAQRREALSQQLHSVQASLAQEQILPIWSFKNPLTTKIGRMAASAGQYAMAASVALVAYGQQELFKANCTGALSSPFAALSCVSTLTDPRVYLSLAVGAAVSFVCKKGMDIAHRILKIEKEAAGIEENLQSQQAEHQRTVGGLERRVADLTQRSSQGLQTLETAQKDRAELDQHRNQLEDRMAVLRTDKMRDIAQTQLGLLREAMDQNEQGSFVRRAGEAAVNTLLDAVVLTYADQPRLAIAASSSSAVAQIEEA